jgi:hypothetical protein
MYEALKSKELNMDMINQRAVYMRGQGLTSREQRIYRV